MKQNKKIAVTGGIGSGKTTFCRILGEMGYPVFSCDKINAELLAEDEYLRELSLRFSDCFENGKLNRVKLSDRVFSSESERKALEELAHPRIMSRLLDCMQREELSFAEVPLLFEGGYEKLFDGVIALIRPEEECIAAIERRSGLSREEIRARMRAQADRTSLNEKNCLLIENNGTQDELRQKAEETLKQLGM